ncbi:hypothetical protein GCM10022212_27450 [Actimicrobium antarcticum]|uniref:Uncharacterized protein n=1 Tax=Actimicrobium antarcticum TaxID=1051899 RepID=A0ABP7TKW4_9BURK
MEVAHRQLRSRSACSGIRKQGQIYFRGEALRKKTLTLVAGEVACGCWEKRVVRITAVAVKDISRSAAHFPRPTAMRWVDVK